MVEISSDKYMVIKDFTGEPLKLTLVKKEEYPDKEYNLYSVCKVVEDDTKEGDERYTFIPLYDETFTEDQYNEFYNVPRHYIAVKQEEDII